MTKSSRQPQPLSLVEALIPLVGLIVLVGVSFVLFGDAGASGPNQVGLAVAAMIAVYVGWRRGYTLDAMREAAVASVGSGIGAIFILLAVGALIGTWAMSGTLIAMVYYGMQILNPSLFYLTACIICAVIALGIGSSWTVVGTIGIGLMGVSESMGLNPAISAAAIISGAYFGDTVSPLSDSANLAAGTGGANLYEHVRETVITSGGALLISFLVFWLLGTPGEFDSSSQLAEISSSFAISPWLFLPLVVVVILALRKVPPVTTIFTGAIVGGIVAVFAAPTRVAEFAQAAEWVPGWLAQIKGVWLALASGYSASTPYAYLNDLVSRGGMESMLDTIWLIITALAFGGVIEKIGALDRLISPIITAAKSFGALVSSLVGSILAVSIATADQYIAVILPLRMFKGAFRSRGYAPVVLTRTVSAAATPMSALIPWNSCGAFMAATLGVATISYLPYAVFNFASPLLAILFGFLGLRVLRAPAEEAAENADDGDPTTAQPEQGETP